MSETNCQKPALRTAAQPRILLWFMKCNWNDAGPETLKLTPTTEKNFSSCCRSVLGFFVFFYFYSIVFRRTSGGTWAVVRPADAENLWKTVGKVPARHDDTWSLDLNNYQFSKLNYTCNNNWLPNTTRDYLLTHIYLALLLPSFEKNIIYSKMKSIQQNMFYFWISKI